MVRNSYRGLGWVVGHPQNLTSLSVRGASKLCVKSDMEAVFAMVITIGYLAMKGIGARRGV